MKLLFVHLRHGVRSLFLRLLLLSSRLWGQRERTCDFRPRTLLGGYFLFYIIATDSSFWTIVLDNVFDLLNGRFGLFRLKLFAERQTTLLLGRDALLQVHVIRKIDVKILLPELFLLHLCLSHILVLVLPLVDREVIPYLLLPRSIGILVVAAHTAVALRVLLWIA